MTVISQREKVSVIIPSYRAARTIRRAIDSVMAQTREPAEIIVVDDGSLDGTSELVERAYGKKVILVSQANGGAASARNVGIEKATGDFVAFLDADDYWEPQKLERQLAVFEKYPKVGLVAGSFFEQSPGEERREANLPVMANWPWDTVVLVRGPEAFRVATAVWTGTVLIRREILSDMRFCVDLKTAEDRDLWVRVISESPLYLISVPLATAVLTVGSLSRGNLDCDCTNMLKMVERHRRLLGPVASRVWRSHTLFRWAANDPNPRSALPRLAQSLLLWPLPFWEIPGVPRFGRLKRMLVLLAKASGIS